MNSNLVKFQEVVRQSAMRWLHNIDLDPHSKTYGVCDREYWSWRFKDFANGTWQGGVAGFLDSHELLNFTDVEIKNVVRAVVKGTQTLQRPDGSFEEAYPYESSYCVTALVLFNMAYSALKYPRFFEIETNNKLKNIFEKAISFLNSTPETHGVITNHLVTGDLATGLANKFLVRDVGDCFGRIASLFDEEGWFPEYGGADPGYQTLALHYMKVASEFLTLDSNIIQKATEFVSAFCSPDGSFSGEIGSRGTSIFYPSGAYEKSSDGALGWFVDLHLNNKSCVQPLYVDSGNFVPVFNSWAWLAPRFLAVSETKMEYKKILFARAQLMSVNHKDYWMILNLKNGALRYLRKESEKYIDYSRVAYTKGGLSTQLGLAKVEKQDDQRIVLNLRAGTRKQPLNDPPKLIVLRVVGVFIYLFPIFQRVWKKLLALAVMSSQQTGVSTGVTLEVDFTKENPVSWSEKDNAWKPVSAGFHGYMASANTFTDRHLTI